MHILCRWYDIGQHCSSMYACIVCLPVCGAPWCVLLQHSIIQCCIFAVLLTLWQSYQITYYKQQRSAKGTFRSSMATNGFSHSTFCTMYFLYKPQYWQYVYYSRVLVASCDGKPIAPRSCHNVMRWCYRLWFPGHRFWVLTRNNCIVVLDKLLTHVWVCHQAE